MRKSLRRPTRARSTPSHECEPLEQRRLFTAFTINGTTSADTINVSWHLRFIQLVQHNFIDWTLNGGATQSQDLAGFASVTVDTTANSSGGDTVNVLATPNIPLAIIGHSTGGIFGSLDTLNVGGTNGLQGVFSPLSLSTSGAWNVTLDDSNDAAAARTATLNGAVTGVLPNGLTVGSNTGISTLTLNMGSFGGSTVNLIQPPSSQTIINGYSQAADDTLNLGANHLSGGVGQLAVGVAPGSPRGLWNVNLDDSADTSTTFPPPTVGVSTGALSGMTGYHGTIIGGQSFPNGFTWGAGSIRNIVISPGSGDIVTVGSLDVPMTVNLANSQMQVGQSSNGLQSVTAPLAVNGSGFLTLTDTNDVTSRAVLMSRSSAAVAIDGLAPSTISYNLPNGTAGFPTVELDLWNNFDGGSLTVLASGQTGSQTKVVSPRPLAITVGNPTTIPDIQGVLTLYCSGSNLKNTLSVDDSIDSTARNISVTATKDTSGNAMGVIHGLPGGGDVQYAHAQTAGPVVISGGSGGNTFTVAAADPASGGVATSVPLSLNLGSGNDSATIKTNAVTVNGQAGNDTVTVDYSTITVSGAGTFAPGNVTFDGGPGSDTISILGKLSTQPFGVVATAITQGAQTTSFSNVESMALSNGAFALANDLNNLNLSLSGIGSTAAMSTSQHLGTMFVGSGAVATLNSSASSLGKTLFATALTLTAGTLDLTNNALQITYTTDPAAALRTYLSTGYNNGTWTGPGLRSSTAASGPANVYSLGLADSVDNYVAGLAANTLLVRYTVMGDANLDGVNNYTDALRLQSNYNRTSANWDQADFNFDGVVNSLDALLLSRNYNTVLPAAAQPASQPTPPPQPTNTPPSAPSDDTSSPIDRASKHDRKRHGRGAQ